MATERGRSARLGIHLTNWDYLIIGTIAIPLASSLLSGENRPAAELAVFFGLGLIYGLLAVILPKQNRLNTRARILTYLVIQTFLALTIIYLGKGEFIVPFIVAPLASQGLSLLEGTAGYLFGALLAFSIALPYILMGERTPGDLLSIVAGYGMSIAFIQLITWSNEQEFRMRAEVERLNLDLISANQKLRDYASQSAELAAVQERNRIAREIHDSLGHSLTTVSIELDVAEQLIQKDPEKAASLVHKARSLTRQGLEDVRRSVAALRSDPLGRQPLPDAIQTLVDDAPGDNLAVTLSVTGERRELGYPVRLALYRAAQEALTNIHKHAQATQAQISLHFDASCVRLVVENDGPLSEAAPVEFQQGGAGFGLAGLRERVNQLGGKLEASPQPGGGFRLSVEIPIYEHDHPAPDRG